MRPRCLNRITPPNSRLNKLNIWLTRMHAGTGNLACKNRNSRRMRFSVHTAARLSACGGVVWHPTGPTSSQHNDLLPQRQDLGFQRRARPEQIDDNPKNYSAEIQHPAEDRPILRLTPTGCKLRQGQPSMRLADALKCNHPRSWETARNG